MSPASPPKKPSTPHDSLFKFTFGNAENAAGELRAILPEPLARSIDFDTLRHEPGTFIDEEMSDRQVDLLFSARLGENDALMYVVFEHQSTVDVKMPLRMFLYTSRVLERWHAANPDAPFIPLVVPVLLHHTPGGWTAAREFLQLVKLEPETRAAIQPYVPNFQMLIDDLDRVDDDEVLARNLNASAALTLFAFKHGRTHPSIVDELLSSRWLPVLRLLAAEGPEALEALVRYILWVNEGTAEAELVDKLRPVLGPGVEEVVMTAGERLIARGEARGLAKGREEGREEGRIEGQMKLLLAQIKLKFGIDTVDDGLMHRLQTADEGTLERWGVAVVTAATLEEVLQS